MAVIDLRGPGSIPDSIRRLGGAAAGVITSIKHPHKKDRDAFSKALRDNSLLASAFSKLERDTPGFLETNYPFLADDVIESIKAIPPSAAELKEDAIQGALTPVGKGTPIAPGEAVLQEEETFDPTTGEPGVAKTTTGIAGTSPGEEAALAAIIRAGVFGTTPQKIASTPGEVAGIGKVTPEQFEAGAVRDVTGLTPGGAAQDTFKADTFNSALGALDAYAEGLDLSDKQKATLRAALPAAFRDADNAALFAQQEKLARMRLDAQSIDRFNERLEASERAVAARWIASTNVGTPETWQAFFYNREANLRAKGLLDGSIAVENQADIDLFEVAEAFARGEQVDKITQEGSVQATIQTVIGRINQVDRDGSFVNNRSVRLALAGLLNKSFLELNVLTDGRIPLMIAEIPKAKLDPVPFFGPGNRALVIKDLETGEEVDLGEIGIGTEPGTTGEPGPEGPLNFNTVDSTQLSQNDRENLIRLITGQGTFAELLQQAPNSAQRILDARINR